MENHFFLSILDFKHMSEWDPIPDIVSVTKIDVVNF